VEESGFGLTRKDVIESGKDRADQASSLLRVQTETADCR